MKKTKEVIERMKMKKRTNTTMESTKKMDCDLEEALNIVGAGRCQLVHSALMTWILTAAVFEMVGASYVIPAAACDLNLTPMLMGLISSVPNFGIIFTAAIWGKAADKMGRRPILLISTAASGTLGALASLMPNVVTFTICKFAASLFLSCPSSLCYAYAGEMLPKKRRDIAILLICATLMFATALLPLLAWGVLPGEWSYQLGSMNFRPWRLLTIVYALPLVLSSIFMIFSPESPKFLMARGKPEEALDVLRSMYSRNTGFKKDAYPVATLLQETTSVCDEESNEGRHNDSITNLFRPPFLKWTALIGFLMFGIFSSLNGLFIFTPDTINRILLDDSDEESTICALLQVNDDQSNSTECIDTISTSVFQISAASTVLYSAVILIVSLSPFKKRTLLFITYSVTGVGCVLAGFLRQRIVAAIAMSALQFTSLGMGPLTAYVVDIFPTTLRGSAVGAALMFGRMGSIVGANVAGLVLLTACEATFYGFAALLFLCTFLSLLLPKENDVPKPDEDQTMS